MPRKKWVSEWAQAAAERRYSHWYLAIPSRCCVEIYEGMILTSGSRDCTFMGLISKPISSVKLFLHTSTPSMSSMELLIMRVRRLPSGGILCKTDGSGARIFKCCDADAFKL